MSITIVKNVSNYINGHNGWSLSKSNVSKSNGINVSPMIIILFQYFNSFNHHQHALCGPGDSSELRPLRSQGCKTLLHTLPGLTQGPVVVTNWRLSLGLSQGCSIRKIKRNSDSRRAVTHTQIIYIYMYIIHTQNTLCAIHKHSII